MMWYKIMSRVKNGNLMIMSGLLATSLSLAAFSSFMFTTLTFSKKIRRSHYRSWEGFLSLHLGRTLRIHIKFRMNLILRRLLTIANAKEKWKNWLYWSISSFSYFSPSVKLANIINSIKVCNLTKEMVSSTEQIYWLALLSKQVWT